MPKITILRKAVEYSEIQAWILFCAVFYYVTSLIIIAISFAKAPSDYYILMQFTTIFMLAAAVVSIALMLTVIAEGYSPLLTVPIFILCSISVVYIFLTQIATLEATPKKIRLYTGINMAIFTAHILINFVLFKKHYNRQSALEENVPLTQQQQTINDV